MDLVTYVKRLSEPRVIYSYSDGLTRVLYLDNCSSHVKYDNVQECLRKTETRLCKLPANATNLVQPADSFLIQKIKDAWRHRWGKYRLKSVKEVFFK